MRASTLPASKALSPLRRGELSSLCGIYTIVNAVRLVCHPHPPTRAELQDLYGVAIRHLGQRQLTTTMQHGMSLERWLELTATVLQHTNARRGTNLVAAPLLQPTRRDRSTTLMGMRSYLQAGRPILACFGEPLDHYTIISGMTERALSGIEAEAQRRWPLDASLIIHRYGRLEPGDDIVLVITASAHREAAFDACHFLIDWLKTKAPFWKLEEGPKGAGWVKAKDSDDRAAARWETRQR